MVFSLHEYYNETATWCLLTTYTMEFSLESHLKYSIVISSEMADFHFQTSLDDDEFDGFTAEVLRASKKAADVGELVGNDLSDIQVFPIFHHKSTPAS